MQEYRTLLITELEARKRKNPNFSLRSFARLLDVSPAHLSFLINGKKNLTRKQAAKIAEKLNLSPTEAQRMLGSTLPSHGAPDAQLLSEDEFLLISDWYHIGILNLANLLENQANGKWIAKELGITSIQALDAFERLVRLGYVEIEHRGFRRSSKPLTTTSDVPSAAVRKYHKQNLELAKEKIDSVPIEKREFTAITMTVNPKKLPKVKKLINDFKQQISQELEQGEKGDVYTLSIQLFPITTRGEKR